MQAYNLSFGRLEEEDLKFKAILSYVAVLASQTKQKHLLVCEYFEISGVVRLFRDLQLERKRDGNMRVIVWLSCHPNEREDPKRGSTRIHG